MSKTTTLWLWCLVALLSTVSFGEGTNRQQQSITNQKENLIILMRENIVPGSQQLKMDLKTSNDSRVPISPTKTEPKISGQNEMRDEKTGKNGDPMKHQQQQQQKDNLDDFNRQINNDDGENSNEEEEEYPKVFAKYNAEYQEPLVLDDKNDIKHQDKGNNLDDTNEDDKKEDDKLINSANKRRFSEQYWTNQLQKIVPINLKWMIGILVTLLTSAGLVGLGQRFHLIDKIRKYLRGNWSSGNDALSPMDKVSIEAHFTTRNSSASSDILPKLALTVGVLGLVGVMAVVYWRYRRHNNNQQNRQKRLNNVAKINKIPTTTTSADTINKSASNKSRISRKKPRKSTKSNFSNNHVISDID